MKKCKECKKILVKITGCSRARFKKRKFCSSKHANSYNCRVRKLKYTKLVKRFCKNCGHKLIRKDYEDLIIFKNRDFCDLSCVSQYFGELSRIRSLRDLSQINNYCPTCKSKLIINKNEKVSRFKERNYCDADCYFDSSQIKTNGKKVGSLAQGKNNPMYGKKRPDLVQRNKHIPLNGKDNPSWIDGRSYEPYPPEYYKILPIILERDNYTCQKDNCGFRRIRKRKLKDKQFITGHHINYNKKDNRPENVISICNIHNTQANGNKIHGRDYWQTYYERKMLVIQAKQKLKNLIKLPILLFG